MPKYQSRSAYYLWRSLVVLLIATGIVVACVGISIDHRAFNPEQQQEYLVAP